MWRSLIVLVIAARASAAPSLRALSGRSSVDPKLPAGSLVVRLAYDDDAKAAANLPVALVAYQASGRIVVVTQATDAAGQTTFAHLDSAGTTSYFVLAELPRAGKQDRLASTVIIPDATSGVRLVLAGERRASAAPAIDELATLTKQAAVAKDRVRVALGVLSVDREKVTIIDAVANKVVATATLAKAGPDAFVDVPVAVPAGSVLYAETIVHDRTFRSAPFQPVSDRGTVVGIYVLPRITAKLLASAEVTAHGLVVVARYEVSNNSWTPFDGVELPLPAGFTHGDVAEPALVKLGPKGLAFLRALPPGSMRVRVAFELAATAGRVTWTLDAPFGLLESSIRIEDEPGLVLAAPGATIQRTAIDGKTFVAADAITVSPGKQLVATVTLPARSPKEAALEQACDELGPRRNFGLAGKPAPALPATTIDGKPLASARGKVALVHFIASWDALSATELATLAPFARAHPEVVVMVVANDNDPAAVKSIIGDAGAFRIALDPPPSVDRTRTDTIGPITLAWGTHQLPETYVVDGAGIVRLYLDNSRDWSKPAAASCIAALYK